MNNYLNKISFFLLCVFLFSSANALTEVNPNNPNAPLLISSEYSSFFSPGKAVPVNFSYSFSCPSAYSISIYSDNDLSDSICDKIVKGMGWIVKNTYSGIVCERVDGSNSIEDVCGIIPEAKDGSYTLRVTLFDKDGNPTAFDSRVGAIKIKTNKPDIEVESVSFPEKIFVGQNIPIKVRLINNGLRDATSFDLSLYLSSGAEKFLFKEKKVFGLKSDSTEEIEFDFDSTDFFPKEYFLEAVVDSGFDVDEQNENNNILQRKMLLGVPSDYPDLIISSLDYVPLVNQGELVSVNVQVKNNGLIDVTKPFIVSVLNFDGKIIDSKIVYGLKAGKEKPVYFSISSSDFSGKTTLSVSVDKLNSLSELSKGNNSKTFSFDVLSDEVITAEECFNGLDDDSDGLIDEGCKTDYAVELQNYVISSSNEKILSVFDSSLQENKLRFNSSQVPSFFIVPFEINTSPGENKDLSDEFSKKEFCVNVSFKDKSNELFFVFSANPKLVSVSNKNISFLEFVDSFGDFYSYLWTVDGVQKKLPESYASSLFSKNFSEADSGFYFAPALLGFDSDFEMTFTSDCYETGSDGNPSNDSKSLLVKIVSREEDNGIDDDDDGIIDNGFDLKMEDFYFEPEILFEQQESKAVVLVKNQGKLVSPLVKVSFFEKEAKEKNLVFSGEIGSVNPGETKTFSFDFPSEIFSEIENNIIAVLDYENSFAESDELNNDFSSVLFKYSDFVSLKINEVKSDRVIVSPGDSVTLSAKIKNNGFVDSAEFFVIVKDSVSSKIVDSVKVSGLKAGINLQNLEAKNSLNKILFASELNFDDLSSVTVQYDYVISGDLTGNRAYDVCISSEAGASGIASENCKKIFFVVSTKPDLKVNVFKPVNELSVNLGKPVLLELEIENQGVLDAENFSVQLYFFDKKGEKKVINSISGFSLKSGETESIVLSAEFSKEINGSIFAEIDAFNVLEEDNESNNIVSVNLFSFLTENCYNNLDDDFDGLIDESCSETSLNIVNDNTVRNGFVLEPMQKEIVSGKLQKIVFYHSAFGPLAREKITVISPTKKTFDFFTGEDGSVTFLVDELGKYEVFSSVKSVDFRTSFNVISEEQANYSFVFLLAEFFFGSPQQTNPFLIPVLVLLSFLCGAYVFSVLSKNYFNFGDLFVLKSQLRTGFSLVIAFIMFLIVLFSNKAFGLIPFIGVFIALIAVFYLMNSFYAKQTEEKKFIRIRNEQSELKEARNELNKDQKDSKEEKTKKNSKKKKAKFTLRI